MNWADWLIVAIVVISSLISVKRGFVKEAFSLLVWASSFFIALTFHERLATLFVDSVSSASLRYILSFAILFAVTLIVGSLINHLLGELVKVTGLSGTDRTLGIVFGATRGVVIVMAILIMAPMVFPVEQDRWWHQSALIPQLLLVEHWFRDTFGSLIQWVSGLVSR